MGKQRRHANMYAKQQQTRKRKRKIAKLHITSGLFRVKLLRLALKVVNEAMVSDHSIGASVLQQFFQNVHLPQPTLDQWVEYEKRADREEEEEEEEEAEEEQEEEEEEEIVSLAQYLLTRPGVSVPLHEVIFRVLDLSRKGGICFSIGEFAGMFPQTRPKSIENGVRRSLYKKPQLRSLWQEHCWDYRARES